MNGLNLHNVVAGALAPLNPFKTLVFTKKTVEWSPDSFTPKETVSTVTVQGKVQPASLQELRQTGFNLQEYQYFRVFLSLDATQLDRVRQLGSDEFECEGLKYRIVSKEDWIQNGWREAYCYLVDTSDQSVDGESGGSEQ